MVPPRSMDLFDNCHNNIKFVHVGKTVATKYSAIHVDSRETVNIHSILSHSYNVIL